ncbi:MAG: hypothetical protein U9P50_00390 [Patescibacteria group bacterium]|nr:hypothetical protein [Patescibacteria group bacterium]
MNLIITIPIFRNRFQKAALFFSTQKFLVGSMIFVPYSKSNQKPALVIKVENLEKEKFFLRKNKVTVKKLNNSPELNFFDKEIIKLVLLISEKRNLPIETVLSKILSKKIISQINKLTPTSDIQINIKKITADFIKNKFKKPKQAGTLEDKLTKNGIKNISDLLPVRTQEKTSLHSEKHYLANEIRSYFSETAKKGKGSFSFYLGFFKRIPEATIYQYWAEVKESRKSIKDQQKLFWWKIGQHSKKKD